MHKYHDAYFLHLYAHEVQWLVHVKSMKCILLHMLCILVQMMHISAYDMDI